MKNSFKKGLLTLMLVPVLAACNQGTNYEEVIAETANRATAIIGVGYGKYAQTDGIGMAGALLTKEYTLDNYNFEYNYSVAPFEGKTYDINYITFNPESYVLNVEIPTFAELNADGSQTITFAAYVLTGKVIYKGVNEGKEVAEDLIGQEVYSTTWNLRVNAEEVKPIWQPISEARKATKGKTVVTTGYISAFMNNVDSDEYRNGVWIADGSEGIMLYSGSLPNYFQQFKIGDKVLIIGEAAPYNDLFEVKPDSISISYSEPQEVKAPAFKKLDEAGIKALTKNDANDCVEVEGCTITTDLSKIEPEDGGFTINVKVGSTTTPLHVNKHTNKEQRVELYNHLVANAGKTFTLRTVLGYNSGKVQFSGVQISNEGTLTEGFVF